MTREDIFKTVDHTLLARQQLGKKLKKYAMMRSNTRQHLYVFQHLM